jgi:acetyl-CoA carboxylase biotin carboxyl carrier protein
MSKTVIAAITDARALLDTFLASDLQDMHVAVGGMDMFLARKGGRANPMTRVAAVPAPAVPAPVASAAPLGKELSVKAPHVANVVWLAPVGQHVAVGEKLAVLRVLDEEIAVQAAAAGHVLAQSAQAGALVEYDMPLLTLREAA